jgi:hypothetical protein
LYGDSTSVTRRELASVQELREELAHCWFGRPADTSPREDAHAVARARRVDAAPGRRRGDERASRRGRQDRVADAGLAARVPAVGGRADRRDREKRRRASAVAATSGTGRGRRRSFTRKRQPLVGCERPVTGVNML